MKILYLPAYFYPETTSSSFLTDSRNRAFADNGFEMVTYTPTPSRGVSKDIRKEYSSRYHRVETMYEGKMIVHRFPLYAEGRSPILRGLRYIICLLIQFHKALWIKNIDCVYLASTPPIQGLIGATIKKIRKFSFIYNLQDIFPDSLVGTGLARKGGILWKIGRMIENITYRNADKIIVISEDFKKNIMAKGVPEEKIVVVYNWVDENAIQPVAKEDNLLYEEFGLSRDKFTVIYAGNLGNAQNINIILNAAYSLPYVQFAIFGSGGMEDEIRDRITADHLTNIHLNPLQPMERVSQVYSLGDACIVSCRAGLGGSAMPSKTWSIMSCGRPVIASFDEGELKDILEKNDCGLFTHAENGSEFVAAIRYLKDHPDRCNEMGRNARQFILENLTKEVGTRKYVEVIRSVAGRQR